MLYFNKKMMDDEPGGGGGSDDPIVPELVANEATAISAFVGDPVSSQDGMTINVINAASDAGYATANYKTETWHDFHPSFLTSSEEEPPAEPGNGGGGLEET